MIKKIVGILTVTILFGCSEKKRELTQILAKDSIQYWNYEWKRNFPDEFGKTFCFNKNGELLEYLYIKKSEHRVIYKKAFRNPNRCFMSRY